MSYLCRSTNNTGEPCERFEPGRARVAGATRGARRRDGDAAATRLRRGGGRPARRLPHDSGVLHYPVKARIDRPTAHK